MPEQDCIVEEWREIAGFPGYRVSTLGGMQSNHSHNRYACESGSIDIWNDLEGQIVCNKKYNQTPYKQFGLYKKDGKRKYLKLHVIMLETFVSPRPHGMFGCHSDGNSLNNVINNLRWDTPKNNSGDRNKHGTAQKGEIHYRAKLTENDVLLIRKMCKNGKKDSEISKLFNTPRSTINNIRNRYSWRHVHEQ